MKIDKNYTGIIKKDFCYVIEGDLSSNESIVIDLDMGLIVEGSIKAGGSIEAGRSIKVGGSIEVGGCSIEAGGSIEVGGSIKGFRRIPH